MERIPVLGGFSRRTFMQVASAAALYPGLSMPAFAQAKFRRKNVEDPSAANDLASYKLAVEAMLKLPPDDPRNWYRLAVTHLIDCPHGNWWFFPWHRAYLGWFERTCRELSGDANFALPYWDWTASPKIPASFFGNVLDPTTDPFLPDAAAFEKAYKSEIEKLWLNATPAQQTSLTQRGFTSFDVLWSTLMANFAPRAKGRRLTASNPNLPTPDAVKLSVVEGGLKPKKYVFDADRGFSSAAAPNHSIGSAQAIIEGIPHNTVHNDIGGNMPTMLSPIDPIFYMHHSNIDRLWDVWDIVNNDAPNVDGFKNEEFLFFVDAKGKPVAEVKTSDYMKIGPFDYDYQPGSGTVPLLLAAGEEALPGPLMAEGEARFSMEETATLEVPLAAAGAQLAATPLFDVMELTFLPPAHGAASGVRFNVFLSAGEPPKDLSFQGEDYVNSITLFGHGAGHEVAPMTFTVPVREALEKLAERGTLSAGTTALYVTLLADEIHPDTISNREAVNGQLLGVKLGNF